MNTVFDQENVEGVIHFAAFSVVPESMKNPLKYFDNNTAGMVKLLEVMAKHDVKKIVFSSTAATYGEPKQVPMKESDPQVPTNPYGESKLAMEKIMHWSDVAYGIKFVALRYFNVAGAKPDGSIGEDHAPETHLVPIILQVAAGETTPDQLQIFGDDYPTPDGTNVRDYVHVVDLADAHILALEYLKRGTDLVMRLTWVLQRASPTNKEMWTLLVKSLGVTQFQQSSHHAGAGVIQAHWLQLATRHVLF